jgi:Tol biopolymer transport system component
MRKLVFVTALLGATFLLLLGQETKHITNLKQITTQGGQNAEAYWSPDGKRLIFQWTPEDAKCDQEYIMNADGSNLHRISNGKGATTCGFFLPDNKTVLYASTHEGGDTCPPPADHSKGYVWAVYPSYDVYLADDTGKMIKKLTTAAGYDAEATVNFKTKKIIYTSMASGDLDLWTMNLDGGGKKRITTAEGYDGGAIFSHDGTKIVWRANHPDTEEKMKSYRQLLAENLTTPMKMELWVSDANGSHAKQVTNFGCASFAPTFTPDDKKILFSSNKHHCDSSDFDLYSVNLDGSGLERVTDYGAFTSFPDFSPEGKLVFASSYKGNSKYEFNIFTADWK